MIKRRHLKDLIAYERYLMDELSGMLGSRQEHLSRREKTCEYGRMDRDYIREQIAGLRAIRTVRRLLEEQRGALCNVYIAAVEPAPMYIFERAPEKSE